MSFKVLNGVKTNNYAGDLPQTAGAQTSKAVLRTRPMTGKVQTSGQHATGLSAGLWSFSNLNTISQQGLPQQAQYTTKQSSNQLTSGGQNQFSVVEIRQSESSFRPTKAGPTATNTNANISGAGFVHGAYSVLNNSAVQEANQKQVGKFMIGGSDTKSIAHNYSREDLIQQED